jgi:hypothetical protein
MGIDSARQPHQGTAYHEGLQAKGEAVLAHRHGRRLVVADAPLHPPPGCPVEPLEPPVDDGDQHQHEAQQHQRVAPRHQPVERPRDARDPPDPAGQPRLVLQHQPDDLGDADRRDGEIVGAQPERHQPDQQAQHRGDCHGTQEAQRPGQAEPAHVRRRRPGGQDGAGIGADGKERRHADIQHAGKAPLHVQPLRQEGVDASEGEEEDEIAEEPGPGHVSCSARRTSPSAAPGAAPPGWRTAPLGCTPSAARAC